jgi:hypothetical protein
MIIIVVIIIIVSIITMIVNNNNIVIIPWSKVRIKKNSAWIPNCYPSLDPPVQHWSLILWSLILLHLF